MRSLSAVLFLLLLAGAGSPEARAGDTDTAVVSFVTAIESGGLVPLKVPDLLAIARSNLPPRLFAGSELPRRSKLTAITWKSSDGRCLIDASPLVGQKQRFLAEKITAACRFDSRAEGASFLLAIRSGLKGPLIPESSVGNDGGIRYSGVTYRGRAPIGVELQLVESERWTAAVIFSANGPRTVVPLADRSRPHDAECF